MDSSVFDHLRRIRIYRSLNEIVWLEWKPTFLFSGGACCVHVLAIDRKRKRIRVQLCRWVDDAWLFMDKQWIRIRQITDVGDPDV